MRIITDGLNDVLDQRSRLTSTLRDHIVHHDAGKSRELDDLLRDIERELGTWMQDARSRSRVDIDLIPAPPAIAPDAQVLASVETEDVTAVFGAWQPALVRGLQAVLGRLDAVLGLWRAG